MNNNTPIKETSPDVLFALFLFFICILISLFFDPDSLTAAFAKAIAGQPSLFP